MRENFHHTITFYAIAVTRHYFGVIPVFNNLFHRHETIKVKLNKEHPREGGVYINGPGHMTKMADMAINGQKNSLKLFFFRNRKYMVEASGNTALHSLCKSLNGLALLNMLNGKDNLSRQ